MENGELKIENAPESGDRNIIHSPLSIRSALSILHYQFSICEAHVLAAARPRIPVDHGRGVLASICSDIFTRCDRRLVDRKAMENGKLIMENVRNCCLLPVAFFNND